MRYTSGVVYTTPIINLPRDPAPTLSQLTILLYFVDWFGSPTKHHANRETEPYGKDSHGWQTFIEEKTQSPGARHIHIQFSSVCVSVQWYDGANERRFNGIKDL